MLCEFSLTLHILAFGYVVPELFVFDLSYKVKSKLNKVFFILVSSITQFGLTFNLVKEGLSHQLS